MVGKFVLNEKFIIKEKENHKNYPSNVTNGSNDSEMKLKLSQSC
jgi:hypothetical protein